MNRNIRRAAGIMASLAATILAPLIWAASAFAYPVPAPGGPAFPVQPPPQVHTIVTGGMPGWQITLIATGAALLAAALAVTLDRTRTARQHLTTPSP